MAEDPKLALYLEAERLRMDNDFDAAIPLYEQILEIDPEDLGARQVLAELYLAYGERAKGVRAYYQLAGDYRRLGEMERVASLLRKIRVLDATRTIDVTPLAIAELEQMGEEATDGGETGRTRRESPEEDARDGIQLDSPILGGLSPGDRSKVVKELRRVVAKPRTRLFREGDLTRALFFIALGKVEIRARSSHPVGPMGDDRAVAVLGPGEVFGEFAFLTGAPRSATARVTEDGEATLYMLPRERMDALLGEESSLREALSKYYHERALDLLFARSPLFSGLPKEDRLKIAGLFKLQSYAAGTVLIEEGTSGDDFCLIKSGEVEITKESPGGGSLFLALLGANQFFGEISFLLGKPRSASAATTGSAEILTIAGTDLREILDHYPSVTPQLQKARLRRAIETARRLSGR